MANPAGMRGIRHPFGLLASLLVFFALIPNGHSGHSFDSNAGLGIDPGKLVPLSYATRFAKLTYWNGLNALDTKVEASQV